MSDAQVDTGDTGGQAEDMASDFIGAENKEQAVFFYGIASAIMALTYFLGHSFLKDIKIIQKGYYQLLPTMGIFVNPAMTWFTMSFVDTSLVRAVFGEQVVEAFVTTMLAHWTNVVKSFALMIDTPSNAVEILIDTAIYGIWLLVQSVLQIVLMPSIFGWLEEDDIFDLEASFFEAVMHHTGTDEV